MKTLKTTQIILWIILTFWYGIDFAKMVAGEFKGEFWLAIIVIPTYVFSTIYSFYRQEHETRRS